MPSTASPSEGKRLPDGALDISKCPRCHSDTHRCPDHDSGLWTVHSWWCDLCDGWWQQTGHEGRWRDAVWCPQWQPVATPEPEAYCDGCKCDPCVARGKVTACTDYRSH